MALLEVEGLCKAFDEVVLDRMSLSVERGEFFVIVGPSGIGKTTTLRLLAGLEHADAGAISIDGSDITRTPPYRRNVALTFESYALYPHLSVFENIASPLRARRESRSDIEGKVRETAKLLRIDHLLDRRPGEISGGQKQRTALGRTLVKRPDVFLLDEPLSHLDAKIRHELRLQFHHLEELHKTATVYVTHDYAEALSLGDRIGVMGDGGLVQTGTPREIFERPRHLFVARHMGQPSINELASTLERHGEGVVARLDGNGSTLPVTASHAARLGDGAGSPILGLRPQHLRLVSEEEPAAEPAATLRGQVAIFEALGAHGVLVVDLGGFEITALTSLDVELEPGSEVTLEADPSRFLFFDAADGRSLLVR